MIRYEVRFKESYMPKPITRECFAKNEEQVKAFYDLESDDIEWYEITEL